MKRKRYDWDYCYKFGKIYTYSDFIVKDKFKISFLQLFFIYIYCLFFYLIMLIQIFITFVFIIFNIFIDLKIYKRSYVFNIFIYIPFLMSKALKIIIKNINKKLISILTINLISIYMWGFPRLTINYAYICFEIIKSYKKDPNKLDIDKILEVFECVYINTWGKTIDKLEKINTL